jgi:hypothetical protein
MAPSKTSNVAYTPKRTGKNKGTGTAKSSKDDKQQDAIKQSYQGERSSKIEAGMSYQDIAFRGIGAQFDNSDWYDDGQGTRQN